MRRALFDYDPSTDTTAPSRGVGFRYGDILQVANANDDDWWQAQKVLPREDEFGLIPSRHR